jgi:hypothetical protein
LKFMMKSHGNVVGNGYKSLNEAEES